MVMPSSSNASVEVARYRQRLEALYDLVERAVRTVDPTSRVVRTSEVTIDEQSTGPYTVPSLELDIPGRPEVRLVPKGIYNIGARGRADARSRLGTQVLVWVEGGGPRVKGAARVGEDEIETSTRPVFADVPEGWAWTDNRRVALVHLTEQVLIDQVLPELIA